MIHPHIYLELRRNPKNCLLEREETKGSNIEILTLEFFSYFRKTVCTQTFKKNIGTSAKKSFVFSVILFLGLGKFPGRCVHCTVFCLFHIGNCSTKFNQLIFKPVFFGVAGYISIKQFNIKARERVGKSRNGILFQKLFWPILIKKSSD